MRAFEKAMGLFHKGDFAKAREAFLASAGGPNRDMGHTAQMHIRMCERRLSKSPLEPKTSEDHYNYAVTLMNRGQFQEAEEQFRKSLAGHESADYIHYALALCCGLRGNMEAAAAHLKRAIELRPQNRMIARNDPDFMAIASHSPLRDILLERTSSG